ncbi:transcription factor [Sarracenia purpurea var. burkii]
MICGTQNHNHNRRTYAEKMQRCQEYVDALEEERRKIQVFQRELPLCLELVTQAIESCKQQLSSTADYFHGQSECSEQTSSEVPVLEQFIPIKRNSSSDDDDDEEEEGDEEEDQSHNPKVHYKDKIKSNEKSSKKSDWLKSVQLWNQTPDLPTKAESPRKVSVIEVKRNGCGAFHPFKKEKSVGNAATTNSPSSVPAAAASSTTEIAGGCSGGAGGGGGGGGSKKEDKEGQSQRKSRRCWSPELHRRFLNALQQLGGSHAATPKQIRELMKIDGLTNDEVKSHLQKYRLHTRRPTTSSIHNNNNAQAPQFVVVGGIWVPPPDYSAAATTAASGETSGAGTPNGVYAPVATAPPPPPPPLLQTKASQTDRLHLNTQSKPFHSDERGSHGDGGVRCNSPATSSSTHTTTASLAF